MNVLIDIGHPAHVHLFKHLARELINQGSNVIFTVRSGEKEADLLKAYGFNYEIIGEKKKGFLNKVIGLIPFSLKIYKISIKYKTSLFLSHGSMYAGYASFLKRKPHIALEDTGNLEQLRLSKPFSNVILSPESLQIDLGKKHLRYNGFHELAYLHPKKFNPNYTVLSKIGISNEKPIILLRFSSWNASHDFNISGFSLDFKKELINTLSSYGKIFISSESPLPIEFKKYRIHIEPEMLHDLLSCLSLYVGEGATTASECAVLGIPAIYYNPSNHGVIQAQEQYGLLFHFNETIGILEKAIDILSISKTEFQNKRNKLITEKINVSDFLFWFVNNYPESEKIFRDNPDFQYNFK